MTTNINQLKQLLDLLSEVSIPVRPTPGVVMVRSRDAGVFFGRPEARTGDEVILRDVRRCWYWAGAATLSELATKGTAKPSECKFPAPVSRIVVLGVCEVIDMTAEAVASLSSVAVWSEVS